MSGKAGQQLPLRKCEALLEYIPAGLITIDNGLKVEWYNNTWAEEFGDHSGKKLAKGIDISMVFSDEPLIRAIVEALSGNASRLYGFHPENETPGKGDRFYDMTAAPLKDEKGTITGAVVMATDVTEHHRDYLAIESAKSEAEFYVDLMSHDIRNFNQVTMGYIELLQLADNLNETEKSYLEKAQKGVFGSNKLIDNIKKIRLIRQFAGKTLVKTDLGEILQKDAKDVEKATPSAHIILDPSITKEKRYVMADEYVHEIFRHIMENAVKYDPHSEKEIEVSVSDIKMNGRDGHEVRIADHGVGVPDDKKKSIFERMTTTTKGAGVGLSIVNVIVTKYGGRIRVEDRVKGDPSKGSVFIVDLPKA